MPKKKSKTNTGAVAGYIRKSNLIWPPGCTSLEARIAFVDELRRTRVSELITDAAQRDQTIDVWYDDMGISGTGDFLEKRLAFDQMRRDAIAGRVRCLYARDLSRLFRNLVQQELWFGEMENFGVEICIQDLPFIADQATRTLLRQNVGSINQYFATRQGEVIRASNLERVRSGQWVGSGRSMWGLAYNKQTKRFDFDPATADKIVRLFTVFVECRGVAGQAVKRLNALIACGDPQGFRTSQGKLWSPTLVLLAVRNPLYRRRVRYVELEFDAPHLIPEVVPPSLVAEADRLLVLRAASPDPRILPMHKGLAGRSGRVETTYGALLRCAYCDGRMRLKKHQPKKDGTCFSSWSCRLADGAKVDCPRSSRFSEARLDTLVRRGLAAAFREAALSAKSLARTQKSAGGQTPKLLREKGDPAAALAKLEEKQKRCYALFINGLIADLTELRPQLAEIAAQKKALQEQIAAAGGQADSSPAALPALPPAAWRHLVAQFEAVWPAAAPSGGLQEAKHAFLRTLGVFIHAGAGREEKGRDEEGPGEAATERAADGRRISRFGGPLCIRLEVAALERTGEYALALTETPEEYAAARQARFLGSQRRPRSPHGWFCLADDDA